MMKNFTAQSFGRKILPAILILFLIVLFRTESSGQTKIYANSVSNASGNGQSSLTGCGLLNLAPCYTATVENAANALTASETTFATIKSSGGLLLGIGSYAGELELKFPGTLPAGTTAYIRIDTDPALLNQLLGGNLGGLLSGVVGGVVLGNHSIEAGAKNAGGTTVLSGSSSGGFTTPNIKLITDANGYFYLALRPNQDYDRVYLRDVTNALLLGTLNNTRVYNAFYVSGVDACAPAFATDFEGNGLTLDVLGLGKAGVTNPNFAIDANTTNYSELGLGALGVAGSISQNFYFSTPSVAGDDFNLKFGVSPALLNAGILNNLTVTAYNGNNQVYTQTAGNVLSLDLIGLLNSGQQVTAPFSPGVAFDRVKVTLSSLLNANLTQTIFIYGLTKSAGRPTFTLPATNVFTICYNTTASLTATTANTNELRWYDVIQGGNALATTAFNGTFTTPALSANKVYYVAARKIGCTEESVRVPVSISVNPAIVFNATTLLNGSGGFTYTKQIDAATGGTPGFSYALANGSTLPQGLVLSSSGLISGTPATTGNFTFSITVTDSKGCSSTANYTLNITAALTLAPGNLPNGITGVNYPAQVISPATGGTGPYVYSAANLPPGLIFTANTREISGTPAQAGTYTIPVTVTDATGNSVTASYTVKISDPLTLPAAALANGITGQAYPVQVIPSAAGGTIPYNYAAGNLPPGLNFNPSTREITGTPTAAGNYTIPVTATDADGKTVVTNYSIVVTDALLLPPATLAGGTAGTVYSTQVIPSATGGVGPYTYVATGVPTGLTFNATTREISGTPVQAGNYTISVTVTDSQGRTASNTYALNVIGVLSLPTASLPDGTVGTTYPAQTLPAVSGGTAPYTYSATNLPQGLNFNTATRAITGTPTTGGTFVISVTGTDASNNKVSANYTIVVNINQPVVAGVSVCSGNPATLLVGNQQPGVTYNWYGPTGNTALATNNPGVFTTPVVSSSTTYYVEAVSGGALSARTAVNVSVSPAANPAIVTTNNQVINSGQNTTLTATADAGHTIKWYAAATGGTALATGSNFTTPALTATTTYYVETTNSNGCSSNGRVAVTVTVINGGGNACNSANAQNTGITGLCLLCSINGAGNSTDANPDNFTRISLTAGVAATGFQQLIFPAAGTATDSIRLDLGLPAGLLDLSVLSNITVNVMNGSAIVGSYQLNSSLVRLSVLSGNRFSATLPAGAVYDRVELRFGGLASVLSSLDIYGATIIFPNPTITSGSQTICSGNVANLSATASSGTTLRWFDAATGGTLLAGGATFTTPALTATTTYYIEVAKGNCASTYRIPVVVTVTPVVAVPVLAPVANVCSGSAATLSVNNPDPVITYNWYTSATGGTAVSSGSTFITPALTTNAVYYSEAVNGNCVSSSRAVATITVNQRPSIPVLTASSLTVNSGQTVLLTASSPESGVMFKWYDSANLTTPVFTGATFVTPSLTATTSYYAESVSALGCTSPTRVQITITVNSTGTPSTVPCEAASTQINGVTGIALLAGVFNPGLAVDNDVQTASSLVMPAGVLNASVYQRLYFGNPSNAGDTLKVLVSFPQSLASVGLINNISITTYNGATSNNDAVLLNNAILNVKLLSGNTQALISLIPTAPFDGAELRLNSGVLAALNSVNLNYMQRALAAPKVVSSNVSGCAGLTAVLQVQNPVAGATYRWFDAAFNALADGPSFTTPVLTTDARFYVALVSASGCVSAKTPVDVTVQPAPALPELLVPVVSACAGSTIILQVKNPVNGLTYRWYDVNGNAAGTDGTSLSVTPLTSTTYTVEAVNSCGTASAKATATVNIGALPQAPIINPATVTIVSGTSAVLTVTSSIVGGVINWYSDAATTVLVNTGPSFTTPALTANTTYYVTATVVGCGVSSATTASVIVKPATPGTVACGIATTTLAAGVNGINLGASVFNQPLAVDNDVNTGSTLFIPAGIAGTSVYHRLGFSGGLSEVGDTLRIKIASTGNLLSAAVLPNLTLTTYNGGVSNADAITLNNQLIRLELATNGSEATLTFIPSKQFDGAELRLNSGLVGVLSSVNFNYAQRSNARPVVSAVTATACQGSSALLSVDNPKTSNTYKWYQGTVYQAGKDGATFLTDATLAAGTYDFYVTATGNNGCETVPVKVVVTISAPPVAPVPAANNPASTCINTPVTLSIQPVAGILYNWYDAATSGNLVVNNSNSFTTPANLIAGTYTYYVEAVSGSGCVNATRTPIVINVNQNAAASDILISGNMVLCSAGSTILTASSATVINPLFTWYSDATLTNQVFAGATFNTRQVTANTTYYVTVSGTNRCANTPGNAAAVTVTINPVSVAADINVSGASTVCAGSAITLTAGSAIPNATFTWYSNSTLTIPVFSGPVFTTPALTADVTYYVTVKGDGKCENTPATAKAVSINVNSLSITSDINVTGLSVICKNSVTALSASSATVSNPVFTWYSNAALTSIAFVGSSFTTPALAATTTYYLTVKGDNSCENNPANAKPVTVTVKDYATAADINVSNVNICSGNQASLMASSLTVTQPVFTWYSDASLTIPVYTGPTYNVSVSGTTSFYVTVKGTNKCENAAADAKVVTVNVNPLATTTDVIVNGNTTVCSGSSAVLTASSATVVNPSFTWYTDASLTNLAFVGAVYNTPVLNTNTTYYVTVKGDNKCENRPSDVKMIQVTVNATPAGPVISPDGTTICSGNATTLRIQNPQAGIFYEWYNAASGGNLLTTGTSYATTVLTAGTNYYVQAVGTGGCVNAAGRTLVTVTVNAQPLVPTVAGNNLNICSGTTATLVVTNAQTGVTYNWYTALTGGAISGSGSTFTTPVLTNTTTFYVEALSGSCISANRTPVNINVSPLPAAPAQISAVNSPICSNSSTILNVTSPEAGLTYRWYNESSGGNVLAQGTSFTTPSLATTTIFYVESTSAAGCSSLSRTAVKVTVLPVLEAPVVRVQSTTPGSVTFTWNAVSGAAGYEVSTDNGLTWQSPSNGPASTSHLINGLKPNQAVVILVRATGQTGCQTSANSVAVTGRAENPIGNEIYIPNAFTPNNDGKNDVFLVYGTTIASVNMKIYTQWGQLIYQVNSTTTGWDGTYKGVAQPNGVYVYLIDVELTDGNKVLRKGTVTLIR